LQKQAPESGGQVIVTLGNHEVMNIQNDLRYVSREEYAAFSNSEEDAAYPSQPPGFIGHRRAFSAIGKYGSWLLKQPLIAKVNSDLFVHGGLPPYLAAFDLDWVNTSYKADFVRFAEIQTALVNSDLLDPTQTDDDQIRWARLLLQGQAGFELSNESRAMLNDFVMLFGATVLHAGSVTWYRGTALCHPFEEDVVLSAVLDRFNAERVIMGHTTTGGLVQSRFDGRAILMDTGMLKSHYDGRPTAVVIENDRLRVFYSDTNEWSVPVPQPLLDSLNPGGMTDSEIETFLASAEIIQTEEVGMGITRPKRLTLKKNGVLLRAIFKTVEEGMTPEMRGDRRKALDYSDSYRYDVAAYRLDRLLGLNLVPVAVIREVHGVEGVVQHWVENGINEVERRNQGFEIDSWCRIEDEYELMNLFDALIYNVDRSLANIFYSRSNWRLFLIDHTRSFRTKRGLPDDLRKLKLFMPPAFAASLAQLDRKMLDQFLGSLLERSQIRALLSRRNDMLKQIPEKTIDYYLVK
ncbi:MAG: hypothetical protein V3T39_06020, partial [Gammaproteobacteria bacterium]